MGERIELGNGYVWVEEGIMGNNEAVYGRIDRANGTLAAERVFIEDARTFSAAMNAQREDPADGLREALEATVPILEMAVSEWDSQHDGDVLRMVRKALAQAPQTPARVAGDVAPVEKALELLDGMAETWCEKNGIEQKVHTIPVHCTTSEHQERAWQLILKWLKSTYAEGLYNGHSAALTAPTKGDAAGWQPLSAALKDGSPFLAKVKDWYRNKEVRYHILSMNNGYYETAYTGDQTFDADDIIAVKLLTAPQQGAEHDE